MSARPSIPREDRCQRHQLFATRAEAEAEITRLALRKLRKGSDSWTLLKVFECRDHFHIGRDWRSQNENRSY